MLLSSAEKAALDRDNRQYALAAGRPFSELLQEDVLDPLNAGAVGITADAADVNWLASPGGAFTYDADASAGLSFAHDGGRVMKGKTMLVVAGGSVALAASTTNYVEVDGTGTVSANTVGFTSGRLPLYQVVTGPAAISTVASRKPLLTLIPPNGVDGSMLSAPAQTKELSIEVGTIATAAGATVVTARVPTTVAAGSKLTKVSFVSKDALAASDTNYLTFGLVNKGAAGAGTQALVDAAAAANSTKLTGGSAVAAYVPRDLTLATVSIGTERDVAGGDVLALTFTVTGTLAGALASCSVLLEFTFTN